jgi:hypothetical protein
VDLHRRADAVPGGDLRRMYETGVKSIPLSESFSFRPRPKLGTRADLVQSRGSARSIDHHL